MKCKRSPASLRVAKITPKKSVSQPALLKFAGLRKFMVAPLEFVMLMEFVSTQP